MEFMKKELCSCMILVPGLILDFILANKVHILYNCNAQNLHSDVLFCNQ